MVKIQNPIKNDISDENTRRKKELIIRKAAEIFSKNGLSNTTIGDITDAAGIGKGSFYLYFKNKRELLIECISGLGEIVIPKEAWDDIRNETDYFRRQCKRLTAYLKGSSTLSVYLNMLRTALRSSDPNLAKKAEDTFRFISRPFIKDLRKAVGDGVIRDVDEVAVSVMLMGVFEYLGYLVMMDSSHTPEKVVEIFSDFLHKGLLLPEAKKPEKSKAGDSYWDVMDSENQIIRVHDIYFGEKNYLSGKFGEAELRIHLENIVSISIQESCNQTSAMISEKEGEQITIEIDGEMPLSGESKFGQYTIPLRRISTISLVFTGAEGSQNVPRVSEVKSK